VNNENNVVDVSGMPSGLFIFSLQNGQKVKNVGCTSNVHKVLKE
jgi:hypothetical protein